MFKLWKSSVSRCLHGVSPTRGRASESLLRLPLPRPSKKSSAMPATVVLTGSANAVAPKGGSETYDTSKAALNHLIRELAVRLGPQVPVNGIAPATVVAGSMMFPRERVTQALQKYGIVFSEAESTEDLRAKLSRFCTQRTLTKRPILPEDCANAIVWLTSDQSSKTTGHVISVDGGLTEAFLR